MLMYVRPLVVGVALACATLLQGPLGEGNGERRRNDFRYTPDARMARLMSVGHRSTLADALWLRALPDISREFDDIELKRRWLNGVFGVVTDLEPTYYTVYDYGETYLALIDRNADDAVALLDKGIVTFRELETTDGRTYPSLTRLLIEQAMTQFLDKKDRERTLELLREAVVRPDCDMLTREMLAKMEVDDRDDIIALRRWLDLSEHPSSAVRTLAERDLEITKRQIALRALREFEEQHGRKPTSLDELAAAGLMEDAVAEIVLPGVELTEDGPRLPRLEELDLQHTMRAAGYWCRLFQRDNGRWPTLEELLASPLGIPAAPAGKRWHIDEGKVSVVDAD
jgi:hypothetical protein